MTSDAIPPSARPITGFDLFLSLIVVFNLAIARPLLDLLGRNPEFFVAHDWSGRDAVLLGLLLTVAMPAALGAIAWMASLISPVGTWVHHVLFATLCALLAIQALEAVGGARQETVAVVLALSIGALVTLAFRRSGPFRSFLRMGTFVPLLVLGFFLFGSRANDLLSPSNVAFAEPSRATNPAPIVVIVMDELPLASLMDGSGHIDGDLFPNFARMADDFTWFRDTTTVHNLTTQAVPALLDGRYPERGALPTVDQHPANLFTLLSDQYEFQVLEQVTDLCPRSMCPDLRPPVSFATRWSEAIQDLRIVLGHILLPGDLAASLPPIDETWRGFGGRTLDESFDAQVDDFEIFMGALQFDGSPQLYFLHLMLPHPPWRFLPSGQQYPETTPPLSGFSEREDGTKVWTEESWPVAQAYQRHLLQVGFVDLLLGRLFERLREAGIYDDALIVVASDHGASFRPGLWKRFIAPETLGDVAVVPLLVKRPGQSSGEVEDRAAQLIDILPTIQDVIGSTPMADIDGSSLFAPPSGEVVRQIITFRDELEVGDVFDDARRVALVKYEMFDLDGGITGLFRLAPPGTRSLIGTRVESWDKSAPFAGAARIADPSLYEDIDAPDKEMSPAMIAGTITATSDAVDWPVRIAVAVEGRIWAVTQTFGRTGDTANFYALVPPETFVDGHNQIELFAVEGRGSAASLAPVDIERN